MADMVSANPENLRSYESEVEGQLAAYGSDCELLLSSLRAFCDAPNGWVANQAASTLVGLLDKVGEELAELHLLVTGVRTALESADSASVGGVVSVDAAAVDRTLAAIASATGKSVSDLTTSEALTSCPSLSVAKTAADSGYVNDPVSTATGILIAAEPDIVVPSRLATLAVPRIHCSDAQRSAGSEGGAFGWGWNWWTEVHLRVSPTMQLTLPDGSVASFSTTDDGYLCVDYDLRCEVESDALVIIHGRRSQFPYQRWVFREGELEHVEGELVGITTFSRSSQGRLEKVTHDSGVCLALRWEGAHIRSMEVSDGRVCTFEIDAAGDLVSVENAVAPRRYRYDEHHRICEIVDADAISIETMVYDDQDRVVQQQSQTGRISTYEYLAPLTTRIGAGAPEISYAHDDSGRVIRLVAAGGWTLLREFDGAGQLVKQVNADGTSFARTITPNENGIAETLEWSDGSTQLHLFDSRDRLLESQWRGVESQFEYEGESILPTAVISNGRRTEYCWKFGHPSYVVDADGVELRFEVNPDGTAASIHNALDAHYLYRYDGTGNPIAQVDPRGLETLREFDGAGRLVSLTDPEGNRLDNTYTRAGRIVSSRMPNGATSTVTYDERGLACAITGPTGSVTSLSFNDRALLEDSVLPDGTRVGIEYNAMGLVCDVAIDGTSFLSTHYDGAGRVIELIDGVGRVTSIEHQQSGLSVRDGVGLVHHDHLDWDQHRIEMFDRENGYSTAHVSETGDIDRVDANAESVVLSYTPAGRVQRVARGEEITEYHYDAAGQVAATNDGSGWWRYERDLSGNIVRLVSPVGRTTSFEYGPSGRCVAVSRDTARWEYGYDSVGNVVSVSDPVGAAWSYDYDVCAMLQRSTAPDGALTTYRYDELNNLTEIEGPLGTHRSFSFDMFGNLERGVDALNNTTHLHRNEAHEIVRQTMPDGSFQTLEYGQAGELRSLTTTDNTQLEFGYDDSLQLRWLRSDTAEMSLDPNRSPGPTPSAVLFDADGLVLGFDINGLERRFERNDRGLVVAIVDQVGQERSRTEFEHDLIGRIVRRRNDGGVTEFGYDVCGRLTEMTRGADSWCWVYDLAGRVIRETSPTGVSEYTYDVAGRLITKVEDGETTSYDYDTRGRRVRESGRSNIEYEWDDFGLARIRRGHSENTFAYDLNGHLSSCDGQQIDWTSFPVAAIGDQVATGTLEDPWGATLHDAGGFAPHPFGGPALDGLVWLGQRVYDSRTRQFLSVDPEMPIPGQGGGTWDYGYAACDPINMGDPTGRSAISLDEMNRIADRYTGVQWGNVAYVVATVAIVAATVAFPPAGLLATVGVGAAAGGGPLLVKEITEEVSGTGDKGVDWGGIAKGTILGGITAGAASKVPFLSQTPTSRLMSVGQQALNGSGSTALGEVWDSSGLPGGDGSFDPLAIAQDGALGGLGGAVGFRKPKPSSATPTAPKPAALETTPTAMPKPKPSGPPATNSAPIESGNYVVSTPRGEYVGQSGNISNRLDQHVASGKFTQAEVDAAQRISVPGSKLDREIAEQLLIDSKGGVSNLINVVNPIGPKRFGVMPNQPYVR